MAPGFLSVRAETAKVAAAETKKVNFQIQVETAAALPIAEAAAAAEDPRTAEAIQAEEADLLMVVEILAAEIQVVEILEVATAAMVA
jgi:hypothetical protein